MSSEFSQIDLIIGGILLISMGLGIKRGVIQEIFSLLAWGMGLYLASHLCGNISRLDMLQGVGNIWLRYGVAFTGIVALVLIGMNVLAKLIRLAAHGLGLGLLDHLLGAGFGLLRGGLIVTFFTVLANWLNLTGSMAWQNSIIRPTIEWVLATFAGDLTTELSRFMTL